MVLQLADDLDVFAFLSEHLPDSVHISSFADKGGKNHVDALLHTKLKVLNVLLRHCGQVNFGPGQVYAFLAAQHASVLNFAVQEIRT